MSDALLGTLGQQLAAGGSVQDALAGLAGTDPALGLLSQLLARREQTLERDLEAHEQEESLLESRARLEAQLEETRRLEEARQLEEAHRLEVQASRMARLRRHLESLEGELARCQNHLDDLALALGACPNCWGEDAGCRLCRGRGRPGFLRPEPEAFGRLIAPALSASTLSALGASALTPSALSLAADPSAPSPVPHRSAP